ncbi:MAG: leucine--tRNA ligase [Candidatus Magasanikbacteria bacterium]|nr:leucine--tRNA ligase [Candidatus Magasanikbacteria bacterium]
MQKKYNHKQVEAKWKKYWEVKKLYKTKDPSTSLRSAQDKPKQYILDMFPYPSGAGLHVGHPKGYIATDVVSRMKMMQGYNVLHPMGWDAFGLPAENYALKNKVHPAVATKKNIQVFKKQLGLLGFTYDWDREINTTDPNYYKWTQWIFLQMFKRGLAYESNEPINWCPSCKTGLANEDLEDGKCERCGSAIEQKPMRQWVLKITDYAERLLKDLDTKIEVLIPHVIDKKNPPKPGKKTVERKTIHAIVRDPKTGKFLCLHWKNHPWTTFIVGGIEDNEEVVSAAKREVLEETGYDDLRFVKILGGQIKAEYYAAHKDENRIANVTGILFELNSHRHVPVAAEEADKHEAIWLDKAEITEERMTCAELSFWLEQLDSASNSCQSRPLLDWPESIKEMQRNWIGRSEGINFKHKVKDLGIEFEAYDSIPQTFLAQTFVIIAPEHPLVKKLVEGTDKEKSVMAFAEEIKKKKLNKKFDIETDMEGIFTGRYSENYMGTGKDLPIWVASFALMDYGTGIVGCSAHDERDFKFAKKYNLPLLSVLFPVDKELAEKVRKQEIFYRESGGILEEPKKFAGMRWDKAREPIIDYIVENGWGRKTVNYKLRDWVFSRQRYWGEPIPLVHCEKCARLPGGQGWVAVSEKDLPLELPKVKHYEPSGTGESPLANIKNWVNTKCPQCGRPAKRETNTMPQWAGSCWYYLAYCMKHKNKYEWDKEKIDYWNPVDLYVGGAEHATRHLIYARFWHKFLYDIGAVSAVEPFTKLQNVGLILAEDGRKMSKRWNNVINPDDVVKQYGADAMRLYEMFMGPFDQPCAWSTQGVVGMCRFLDKVWNLKARITSYKKPAYRRGRQDTNNIQYTISNIQVILHQTIKKVTEDIENLRFNTAISQLMILTNEMSRSEVISPTSYATLLQLLAPFAPHICEELWSQLGNKKSIFSSDWPKYDADKLAFDTMKLAVQVNGRVRATIEVATDASEEEIKSSALADENVKKWLEGKEPKKIFYVRGRLVSVVV